MQSEFFLFLISCSTVANLFTHSVPLAGFTKAAPETQYAPEKKFDANLRATNVDRYIKEMSAVPHHVGSAGCKATTDYILNKFQSWGFDAELESYYVLFPTYRIWCKNLAWNKGGN